MNTTAKKLSLDEIKTLPRGSVLWAEFNDQTEEGIVWYSLDPVCVCAPGENGCLIGGNKDSIIERTIDDQLLDDLTIWSSEPDRDQLSGITQQEYDNLDGIGDIVFPELAAAITSRRYTFKAFCESAGLNYSTFWEAITGKREFEQWEMVEIRNALNLTDDETRKIFFPVAMAQI